MKVFLFLLVFAFLGISLAEAQNHVIRVLPEGINKELKVQPKTDFRNHFFLGSADTLVLDSVEVHFPEMFPLN